MASIKIFIIVLLTFFVAVVANAQVIFIKQIGQVVFNGSSIDSDTLVKMEYAALINEHIQKKYSKKKIPFIYLSVRSVDDPVPFELAYDNLNGNSLENKTYDREGKYDTPGLRIKIYSRETRKEELLALLDYGLTNLKELKKIRNAALKKEYYDQPETLSLSQERIREIISRTK